MTEVYIYLMGGNANRFSDSRLRNYFSTIQNSTSYQIKKDFTVTKQVNTLTFNIKSV